jgi:hypothetical protein
MAPYRAWANGLWLAAVFTAIVFQSKTTSALVAEEPNKTLTINTLKSLKVTSLPYIFFIVIPPNARGVLRGMIAISNLNVHSEPCVAALWFVSR